LSPLIYTDGNSLKVNLSFQNSIKINIRVNKRIRKTLSSTFNDRNLGKYDIKGKILNEESDNELEDDIFYKEKEV